MKKKLNFLSDNFLFLVVKFSIYLNRRVFVMQYCGFQAFPSKKGSTLKGKNLLP